MGNFQAHLKRAMAETKPVRTSHAVPVRRPDLYEKLRENLFQGQVSAPPKQ